AVLLPIVAGQSGNTGSQSMAVTIRSLALKEIGLREWWFLAKKEFLVGVISGVSIALVCALAVFAWSQSYGLALIIAISMVTALSLACSAGALVPIILARFGVDPATASSIILTTFTDVVGFFSFLGIALMLAFLL
ncbi:MAG: magnesium transporter, partial [Gammaproteobacteria bacterium]|nr:magnesium transporter [Gammaproteobacteria bacterium]